MNYCTCQHAYENFVCGKVITAFYYPLILLVVWHPGSYPRAQKAVSRDEAFGTWRWYFISFDKMEWSSSYFPPYLHGAVLTFHPICHAVLHTGSRGIPWHEVRFCLDRATLTFCVHTNYECVPTEDMLRLNPCSVVSIATCRNEANLTIDVTYSIRNCFLCHPSC